MKNFLIFLTFLPIISFAQFQEPVTMDAYAVFSSPDTGKLSEYEQASIKNDEKVLKNLEKKTDYKIIPTTLRKKLAAKIDDELKRLQEEKNKLMSENANSDAINSKNGAIIILEKEKEIVDLSNTSEELKEKANSLLRDNEKMRKNFLYGGAGSLILFLSLAIYLQKRKINTQDIAIDAQLRDISRKNTYLEYAATLIRHDMHSGINTYIPRGLNSLERKISPEIKSGNLDSSLKMIKEGLAHTQKVYSKVYEFTNLVKKNQVLQKEPRDLSETLKTYLKTTKYENQVEISDLGVIEMNPVLFCIAIDNMIKNGLKYNESKIKWIKIYKENNTIIVEDNGNGMDQKKLDEVLSVKEKEDGASDLGLNIASAILDEHGLKISCEITHTGTKIKIDQK